MKKLLFLFSAIVLIATFSVNQGSALSIVLCEEDTIECKIQNCESMNSLARFDGREKQVEDCGHYAKKMKTQEQDKYLFAAAGAIGTTAALAFLFLLPKLTNKRSTHKKK